MQTQKGNMRLVISFIIVIGFVGLIIYTLANPRPESGFQAIKEGEIQPEDSLMEQNTNLNVSEPAKAGDVLVVRYTGKLEDGTVFDSNVDPKFGHVEAFQFTLGARNVIEGWDEGFVGMKIGEKKTLVIPPEKGYGPQAVGTIPPNSTLIFDVELVKIN